MEVLTYIFGNFWHFMGVCVLITLFGFIICEIIKYSAQARIAKMYIERFLKYRESEGDDEQSNKADEP